MVQSRCIQHVGLSYIFQPSHDTLLTPAFPLEITGLLTHYPVVLGTNPAGRISASPLWMSRGGVFSHPWVKIWPASCGAKFKGGCL